MSNQPQVTERYQSKRHYFTFEVLSVNNGVVEYKREDTQEIKKTFLEYFGGKHSAFIKL